MGRIRITINIVMFQLKEKINEIYKQRNPSAKKAGKSIKVPKVIRQREVVTQLHFRSEYPCDK
jgi:hypothetical protein